MIRKTLLVTIACVAGYFMLIWIDQQLTTVTKNGLSDDNPAYTGPATAPAFDPQSATDRDKIPIGVSEDGVLERIDKKTGKRSQVFQYRKMTPRKDGWYDVTHPRAIVFLADNQAMVFKADHGKLSRRGQYPDLGTFEDNLTISLYRGPAHRPVDYTTNSDDRVLQIAMNNAEFNTIQGKVVTDDPVTVTSPQINFHGTGMVLVFNELTRRIQHLTIQKGEKLTYLPAETDPTPKDHSTPQTPAIRQPEPPLLSLDPLPEQPNNQKIKQPQPLKQTTRTEIDLYHATLYDHVRVESDGDRIDADQLDAWFAFKRTSESNNTTQRPDPGLPILTTATSACIDRHIPVTLAAATAGNGNATLPPKPRRPVVITWRGKLVIVPVDNSQPPPISMTEPEDAYLQFAGRPVQINTKQKTQVQCAQLTWHQQDGTVNLNGSRDVPLIIQSTEAGTLTGPAMTIHTRQGQGHIKGAGTLTGKGQPAITQNDQQQTVDQLTISWQQQLSFEFEHDNEKSKGLKNAKFIGGVQVQSDQTFTMQCHRLNAEFDTYGQSDQRQIKQIIAQNHVRATTSDAIIRADQLILTMAINHRGVPGPKQMTATGNVYCLKNKQSLLCRKLIANLTQTPLPEAPTTQRPTVRITQIIAENQVQLRTDEQTTVFANRLAADPRRQTAQLNGRPDAPVRIVRGPSVLTVPEMTITDNGKTINSNGPGRFQQEEQQTDQPHPRRLTVHWQKQMHWSDHSGQLTFKGQVVVNAANQPQTLNQIESQTLTLHLTQDKPATTQPNNAPAQQKNGFAQTNQPAGQRQLQQIEADGAVRIVIAQWQTHARRQLHRRMLIKTEHLLYQPEQQTATIDRPGQLLMEDHSPETDNTTPEKSNTLALSGRGTTVMTWQKSLIYSGQHQRITFNDQATLYHQQAKDQPMLKLSANKLIAILKPTGTATTAPADDHDPLTQGQVTFKQLLAEQNVRLHDGRRLLNAVAMTYQADDRIVTLTGTQDQPIQLRDEKEPRPIRALSFRWDLKTDNWQILKPFYGN